MCPYKPKQYGAEKRRAARQEFDRSRTEDKRIYGRRWRKARLWFLQQNPLCAECLKEGRSEAATVVDHIVMHKGDYELFWDEANWAALCKRHHDSKTAKETRFGR